MNLEVFFRTTFKRIKGEHGRPLNISDALPTLCSIIDLKDTEESNDKFSYLGESITHSAIRFILVKHYSHLNTANLVDFSTMFSSLFMLHRAIDEEIHLVTKYVYASQLSDILNSIMGVLVCFYGIEAVIEFIEPAVLRVINLESSNHPSAPQKVKDPLYSLRKTILDQNGFFAETASFIGGLWRVELKCRMTDKSTLFSHARNGTSKHRAKTAAAQDILNYLKYHSEKLYAPPALPGVWYKLPIDSSSQSPATYLNDSTHSNSLSSSLYHKNSLRDLHWTWQTRSSVDKETNKRQVFQRNWRT